MTGGDEAPEHEIWIVDRIEGEIAVLVEEEGEIVVEVAAEALGRNGREGAVLLVPLGAVGEPVWGDAVRDRAREEAWRSEAEERLDRLRSRDPGGDIEL